MTDFDYEVINNITPIKQPKPRINEGGDCGACCIAGIIGYTAEQLPKLYKNILKPYYGGTPREVGSVNWADLLDKTSKFMHNKLQITEPVVIDNINFNDVEKHNIYHNPYYSTPWNLIKPYIHKLRTYLEAGYIAMTTIKYDGTANPLDFKGTDHWVIINGVKKETTKVKLDSGYRYDVEFKVKIGCSVKGQYWINAEKLIKNHGGFNLAFIRKIPIVKPKIKITK